jgi:uncharacterized protein (DUF1501 family)
VEILNMNRRNFLSTSFLSTSAGLALAGGALQFGNASIAHAQSSTAKSYGNLLILVELKGGNDGLNMVVPYANDKYRELRPNIQIAKGKEIQLSDAVGLHPALEPLKKLWDDKQLAVVQGVGYPQANLSHFRSIEIWETASKSEEYLDEGWLTRVFEQRPAPKQYAVDGVIVGSNEMGPFTGHGSRAIALSSTRGFASQARLAKAIETAGNDSLKHILKVERDIASSAAKIVTEVNFKTEFPKSGFGQAVRTAAELAANKSGVAVVRVTLGGFDTHAGQPGAHANLMKDLGEGLAALKGALEEIGRWNNTVIATYSEFGRRPKENQSNGTDHGTVAPHFVMGGRVNGGLYGDAPHLSKLDGSGNLRFAVDFRSVYTSLLEDCWGIDAAKVLNGKFDKLPLIRA